MHADKKSVSCIFRVFQNLPVIEIWRIINLHNAEMLLVSVAAIKKLLSPADATHSPSNICESPQNDLRYCCNFLVNHHFLREARNFLIESLSSDWRAKASHSEMMSEVGYRACCLIIFFFFLKCKFRCVHDEIIFYSYVYFHCIEFMRFCDFFAMSINK